MISHFPTARGVALHLLRLAEEGGQQVETFGRGAIRELFAGHGGGGGGEIDEADEIVRGGAGGDVSRPAGDGLKADGGDGGVGDGSGGARHGALLPQFVGLLNIGFPPIRGARDGDGFSVGRPRFSCLQAPARPAKSLLRSA